MNDEPQQENDCQDCISLPETQAPEKIRTLRISQIEVETNEGERRLLMCAGEYTGIHAPLPVSKEDFIFMQKSVFTKAEYYMGLPDDAELVDGEDISLAEIKASIMENIVEADPAELVEVTEAFVNEAVEKSKEPLIIIN